MHENINNLASILERAANRNKGNREAAVKVFSQLKSDGENELVAHWIRTHVFAHNLFGRSGGAEKSFLDYIRSRASFFVAIKSCRAFSHFPRMQQSKLNWRTPNRSVLVSLAIGHQALLRPSLINRTSSGLVRLKSVVTRFGSPVGAIFPLLIVTACPAAPHI